MLPSRFQSAVDFASFAHAGRCFPQGHPEHNVVQMRKFSEGVEYIVHPIRCAKAALRYGLSDELIKAMLLHDVIEDCGVSYDDVLNAFEFPVTLIVWGLTNAEARFGAYSELGWNRAKRKAHDLKYMAAQPELTRMGKLIDLADNLNDWPANDKFLDIFLTEVYPLGLALGHKGVLADVLGDFLRAHGDAKLRRAIYVTKHPKGGDA